MAGPAALSGATSRGSILLLRKRDGIRFAMPAPSLGKPALSSDHRRALGLLASLIDGYWEALFLAHGVTAALIEALVAAGHVTVDAPKMHANGRVVVVRRLRITEAGRQVL